MAAAAANTGTHNCACELFVFTHRGGRSAALFTLNFAYICVHACMCELVHAPCAIINTCGQLRCVYLLIGKKSIANWRGCV